MLYCIRDVLKKQDINILGFFFFSKGEHVVSVAMVMSPDHAPIFRVSSIQTIRQKNDDGEAVVKKTNTQEQSQRAFLWEDKLNHAEGNECDHVQTQQRDVVPSL